MVDKKDVLKKAISGAEKQNKNVNFKSAALDVMAKLREHGANIKPNDFEQAA